MMYNDTFSYKYLPMCISVPYYLQINVRTYIEYKHLSSYIYKYSFKILKIVHNMAQLQNCIRISITGDHFVWRDNAVCNEISNPSINTHLLKHISSNTMCPWCTVKFDHTDGHTIPNPFIGNFFINCMKQIIYFSDCLEYYHMYISILKYSVISYSCKYYYYYNENIKLNILYSLDNYISANILSAHKGVNTPIQITGVYPIFLLARVHYAETGILPNMFIVNNIILPCLHIDRYNPITTACLLTTKTPIQVDLNYTSKCILYNIPFRKFGHTPFMVTTGILSLSFVLLSAISFTIDYKQPMYYTGKTFTKLHIRPDFAYL